MKRASYCDAINWIADNDGAADDTANDPNIVAELVTSLLVAYIFDMDPLKVGADIVRTRIHRAVGIQNTITPTMRKVLQQAVDDGGAVELSGIDMRPGWTRRHQNAALQLHFLGFGNYEPDRGNGIDTARFTINAVGRKFVT